MPLRQDSCRISTAGVTTDTPADRRGAKLGPNSSTKGGTESLFRDEIGGPKPLGEAAVDRRQQLARVVRSLLSAPETGEGHRGTQFPGERALISRNVERPAEAVHPSCGATPRDTIPLPSVPRAPAPCRPHAAPRQSARHRRDPWLAQREANSWGDEGWFRD